MGQAAAGNSRYKTSMCIAFAKNGFCNKYDACQYAHGPQELRSAGPSGGRMPGSHGGGPFGGYGGSAGPSSNYKTSMCKNMLEQGHCSRGDSCNFAHSSAELRAKKPGMSDDYGNNTYGSAVASGMKRKHDNVKTVLCTNFSNYGECQFGDSCTFAHGPGELAMNKKQRI